MARDFALQKPYSDWVRCASIVLDTALVLRQVRSAADLGCNCGPWLRALMNRGVSDVVGVDIREPGGNLLIPRDRYLRFDLSKPLDLGRRFDLAIGLETAEELSGDEKASEAYIDNLTRHSDYILFSAAVPGQGGGSHSNEKPHVFWHQKFCERNYAKLDIVRPLIAGDPRIAPWYQRNTFLYVKATHCFQPPPSFILRNRNLLPLERAGAANTSVYGLPSNRTTRILLAIPGMVAERRHVEMLRVQSLLAGRLRTYCRQSEVLSALVCDRVAPAFAGEIEAIGSSFDRVEYAADRQAWDWGIRNPTARAIEIAHEMHCSHILRVIQDAFVVSAGTLVEEILQTADRPTIAGHVVDWSTSSHFGICDEMGIERRDPLTYVHGALMFAPTKIWDSYYMTLPPSINHYFDDCMFSQGFMQSGGKVTPISSKTWEHRHHCDPNECQNLYLMFLNEGVSTLPR